MEKDMNAENDKKISTETAVELLAAAMERQVKRWFIICVVIFTALVLTNGFWIWRESQYEDVVVTQEGTTDGGGNLNFNSAGNGDLNFYGEGETDNQSAPEENGR